MMGKKKPPQAVSSATAVNGNAGDVWNKTYPVLKY